MGVLSLQPPGQTKSKISSEETHVGSVGTGPEAYHRTRDSGLNGVPVLSVLLGYRNLVKNHAFHTSEAAKSEAELLGIQQRLVGLKCKEKEVAGRSELGSVAPQQQRKRSPRVDERRPWQDPAPSTSWGSGRQRDV